MEKFNKFFKFIVRIKEKTISISTSKTKKSIVIKKNLMKNGKKEDFGLNPHSNEDDFFGSVNFF